MNWGGSPIYLFLVIFALVVITLLILHAAGVAL